MILPCSRARARTALGGKTIKVHRARVMEKMKVNSVAELVRLTERLGTNRMN
jgi:FixJ family two-component response regulator